jgi:hypothetical protein
VSHTNGQDGSLIRINSLVVIVTVYFFFLFTASQGIMMIENNTVSNIGATHSLIYVTGPATSDYSFTNNEFKNISTSSSAGAVLYLNWGSGGIFVISGCSFTDVVSNSAGGYIIICVYMICYDLRNVNEHFC